MAELTPQDRAAMSHQGGQDSRPIFAAGPDGERVVLNPYTKQWEPIKPSGDVWSDPLGRAIGDFSQGVVDLGSRYKRGIEGLGASVMKKDQLAQERLQQQADRYGLAATSTPYNIAPVATDIGIGIATGGKSMIRNSVIAAIQSGLPESDQQGMNAGLGAAMTVMGQGASRVGSGIRNMARGAEARLATPNAALVSKFGGEVPPSQAIGGDTQLEMVEAGWARRPFTGKFAARQAETNRKVANRITAKSFGENADILDPEVLGNAHLHIGEEFDKVLEGTTVTMGPEDLGAVTDAVGNRRSWQLMQRDIEAQGGVMTGDQAKQLRKMVGDYTRAQDPIIAGRAIDAVEVIDSAIAGSDIDQVAFRQARERWKNLMQVEGRPGILDPNYNVNPRALLNQLASNKGYGPRTVKAGMTDNLLPETRDMIEVTRGMSGIANSIPKTGVLPGTGSILEGAGLVSGAGRLAKGATEYGLASLYYGNPRYASGLAQMLRTSPTEQAIQAAARGIPGALDNTDIPTY